MFEKTPKPLDLDSLGEGDRRLVTELSEGLKKGFGSGFKVHIYPADGNYRGYVEGYVTWQKPGCAFPVFTRIAMSTRKTFEKAAKDTKRLFLVFWDEGLLEEHDLEHLKEPRGAWDHPVRTQGGGQEFQAKDGAKSIVETIKQCLERLVSQEEAERAKKERERLRQLAISDVKTAEQLGLKRMAFRVELKISSSELPWRAAALEGHDLNLWADVVLIEKTPDQYSQEAFSDYYAGPGQALFSVGKLKHDERKALYAKPPQEQMEAHKARMLQRVESLRKGLLEGEFSSFGSDADLLLYFQLRLPTLQAGLARAMPGLELRPKSDSYHLSWWSQIHPDMALSAMDQMLSSIKHQPMIREGIELNLATEACARIKGVKFWTAKPIVRAGRHGATAFVREDAKPGLFATVDERVFALDGLDAMPGEAENALCEALVAIAQADADRRGRHLAEAEEREAENRRLAEGVKRSQDIRALLDAALPGWSTSMGGAGALNGEYPCRISKSTEGGNIEFSLRVPASCLDAGEISGVKFTGMTLHLNQPDADGALQAWGLLETGRYFNEAQALRALLESKS